ncbi:MAG: discoidin domain-containing protein [Bacteroidales bacterium]
MKNIVCILFAWMGIVAGLEAQVRVLEDFENREGWSYIQSDGVNLSLAIEKGLTGNAIRFDYDFTKGTGYGGIQKLFPLDLPDNYEFSFDLKAVSPANNFEIKFIDSSGNNVWWVNNRNYDFPGEWKRIKIKKRHIHFAWGPTDDQTLRRVDRIEFTVASFVGGKGTLWIDNLRFEPLPPETQSYPSPVISASSFVKNQFPSYVADGNTNTYWKSERLGNQHLLIDFTTRREFGGLHILWLKDHYAADYEILLSDDALQWEKAYTVNSNNSDVSFIRLAEAEARYVKILLRRGSSPDGYGISQIEFPDVKSTLTLNDFMIYVAKHSPRGDYPRYFLEQATYWTLTGVNNDVKEVLLDEGGMVEVEKACFSLEPMIKTGDSLYNWSNVSVRQSLGNPDAGDFEFAPAVSWKCGGLEFNTRVTASGEANKNFVIEISYSFENLVSSPLDFEFYVLMRPFQVNPYYQFLNLSGGVGKLSTIREVGKGKLQADDKAIMSTEPYESFGAASFDEGNLVDLIRRGKFPSNTVVTDKSGLGCGVIRYKLHLEPGETRQFYIVVPFYDVYPETLNSQSVAAEAEKVTAFWKEKTGHVRFNLPPSADRIVDAYRANLAYILVNRDRVGIQPGSRSYERSWIRDGALTSSALLKSGIEKEVRDFIDWYALHQYENGKVPCVVDFRGPDPVPENDSHGELIYLIREYFNFTGDTAYLRSKNTHVLKAVEYIQSLIAERSTDYYKNGNDSVRAHYGLVTESISHEGYSAKPMHSYWDNFFTMKGLKDAVEIQKILGEKEAYEKIKKIRDSFRDNLYRSLELAMKVRNIDYIPGCVELGDFDATSTTIALTPCNELINLPKPQVYNTFNKYYEFFRDRRDGKREWVNYTPYENRLIGSFILLDQPERAHELIEFFLDDQRPQGWHHWAEVVWKDYRLPRYIGDMPHTWVGSDFINAIRSMFVYENEYDQSLVLASALYQDWIDAPGGMSVENLPTYFGELSYFIQREGNSYRFKLDGDVKLPANGIKIRNFNQKKLPVKVSVNDKDIKSFTSQEITVKEFPADVIISY